MPPRGLLYSFEVFYGGDLLLEVPIFAMLSVDDVKEVPEGVSFIFKQLAIVLKFRVNSRV